jgi:hypothetical protein
LVSAHETAARERLSIATQLSEWGEQTSSSSSSEQGGSGDAAVSDISDKIGVLLSELGEQEEAYASRLDESRGVLKVVRNTERSVQPSREGKRRVAEEIQRLKIKEPQSTRLVTLEQELVRAEAENLVAEAQLGNVVRFLLSFFFGVVGGGLTHATQTRQKLKEAYTVDFLATIERAEKQAILARHGLRLLQLLDDTPVVPGDVLPPYAHASQARQILNDAEDDLREWRLDGGLFAGGGDGSEQQQQQQQHAGEEKGKQKEKLSSRHNEVGRGSVAETEGDELSAKY